MKRPDLKSGLSAELFLNYYWLKDELVSFCKKEGITYTGGKSEITSRIASYLKNGTTSQKVPALHEKRLSSFDWKSEKLLKSTKITDNYKSTENVRKFFLEQAGRRFKFSVPLMNWMKKNIDKTLGDAILEWERLNEQKRDKNFKTLIAPQFEYNQYMRDYMADNPERTKQEAIAHWKLKRNLAGPRAYSKSDLKLTPE